MPFAGILVGSMTPRRREDFGIYLVLKPKHAIPNCCCLLVNRKESISPDTK